MLIKHEILFRGSSTAATVGIDEIMRKALLLKSKALIIAHNHPSGIANPSMEDLELTRRIGESCKMMGIKLLDHIIITKCSSFSFSDEGLL